VQAGRHVIRARFFSARDWLVIAGAGALITACVVVGYRCGVEGRGSVEHGRAMAVAGLIFASATLTAALTHLRTWVACVVTGGTVAFSLLLVQVPVLAHLLHLEPLHWDDWARVLAAGALPLLFPPRD